jgi:hypothetical protein
MQRDIAVIIGSLRKGSLSRLTATALAQLAPANLKLSMIEVGQLPLHNQDLDEQPAIVPSQTITGRLYLAPHLLPPDAGSDDAGIDGKLAIRAIAVCGRPQWLERCDARAML